MIKTILGMFIVVGVSYSFSADAKPAKNLKKAYERICKDENQGASKSLIKKCVKDKIKEDKKKIE